MTALLNVPVPTAGTYVGSPFQLREPRGGSPPAIMSQLNFSYGSGGTSIQAYLQSSFDGGLNWCDAISYAALATANARQVASVIQATASAAAATDGTLAAGSNNGAAFGSWWRVKYIVVGTYAASTLRIDAEANVGLIPAGVGA